MFEFVSVGSIQFAARPCPGASYDRLKSAADAMKIAALTKEGRGRQRGVIAQNANEADQTLGGEVPQCGMKRKLSSANGNGGRHCCQPPLRRAKDMPVFATWLIEPEGLSTRSRSWLTSSGVASDRTTPSCEEPHRPTRLRGP